MFDPFTHLHIDPLDQFLIEWINWIWHNDLLLLKFTTQIIAILNFHKIYSDYNSECTEVYGR